MLSKHYLIFVFSLLFFRVLLEVSYLFVISNTYSYEGYLLNFSYYNYIISWIVFLCYFYFASDRMKNITDILYITSFISLIAPLSVMYGYDYERSLMPLVISSLSIFAIMLISVTKTISFKSLPTIKNGMFFCIAISSIFIAFLIFWYFISGVSLNLDFAQVYDFRSENQDIAAKGILGYTNNWTYKIFSMYLLAVALLYRKFFLAVLIVCIQIYFFAASSFKEVLFLPFLVFGIWLYFRKSNSLIFMPAISCFVVAATLLSYFFYEDILLSSLFSRRVFFTPALLNYAYFDFFNENSYIFWSNSILGVFFEYPYFVSLANVIGDYLGSPDMGANNGFISTGYAHAGVFGVMLYALFIGLTMRFINHISIGFLPTWFIVALCIIPIRSFIVSSDFLTVMLTHGFALTLLLIFMSRSKKYAYQKE